MTCELSHPSLGKGEFVLFLQPKHDLNTRRISGAESLSRFVREDGKLVMPNEYIFDFEENGAIKELDFYMLEKVFVFLTEWKTRFGDSAEYFPVSVNFSKTNLESEDFLDRFESVARRFDISPRLIEIEITELHRFHNFDLVIKVVNSLRERGYTVSIDDYGKSSSAFSIIRHVDVDVLKIDRGIIVESEFNKKAYLIIDSVVKLAKKLNVSVVAEGVETESQMDLVKQLGCDFVQGWYFSKALPIDDFVDYVGSYSA